METVEEATILASVPFCSLTGVPGAILDLMLCTADQDAEESQEPVVPRSPSHSFLYKADLHIPHITDP